MHAIRISPCGFGNPPPDLLYIVVSAILALFAGLHHAFMHGVWR